MRELYPFYQVLTTHALAGSTMTTSTCAGASNSKIQVPALLVIPLMPVAGRAPKIATNNGQMC